MEHQALHLLLQKLAGNTILPEEEALLREYMSELSGDKLDALFPPQLWEAEKHVQTGAEEGLAVATAYRTVATRLKLTVPAPVVAIGAREPWWSLRWVRAACMIGLVACSVLFYINRHKAGNKPVAQVDNTAWKLVTTGQEGYSAVQLPDGSMVYLNGSSTIRYPEQFSGTKRQIYLLTGEIFLEVKRNERLPFVINTAGRQVKVLGTSFSVQNRPRDKQVVVAVKTGKVSFGNADDADSLHMLLTPGRKGIYEKTGDHIRVASCNINSIGAWRNDEFVFEDASLTEILEALQYHYGIQYRIDKKELEKKRFKATFRQRRPDDIVRVLAQMGDFNYHKKGAVIIIH